LGDIQRTQFKDRQRLREYAYPCADLRGAPEQQTANSKTANVEQQQTQDHSLTIIIHHQNLSYGAAWRRQKSSL
jgi:hypothetical protein